MLTGKNKMRKIFYFIIGLLLAIPTESFRFFIVEKRPAPWISMTIAYIILLGIGYVASKYIKNNLIYYIIFGIFGLFIEVFVWKVLPQIAAVGILGWIMWFSFWGSLFLIPRLYLKGELHSPTIIFFCGSLIFFILFYLTTKNTGAGGLFFTSLNLPYFLWHFKHK
jgi:hypothetical protein